MGATKKFGSHFFRVNADDDRAACERLCTFLGLARRPPIGCHTADQFVGDNADKDYRADDGEFELRGNAENIDGVVEHAHDGGADNNA